MTYFFISLLKKLEPPIIFSQAITSSGLTIPLFSLSLIPSATNSAIKGKMFGPIAVVTKSASTICSITT